MRPVSTNGLEDPAAREDVLGRSVVVTLPAIDPDQGRPERAIAEAFAKAYAGIFGALRDAVTKGDGRRFFQAW